MVSAQVNISENYQTKAKSLGNQLVENDEDLNSTSITRLNKWCQDYIEDKEQDDYALARKYIKRDCRVNVASNEIG